MSNLTDLRVKSLQLYFKYKEDVISIEKYQEQLKPLDKEIDKLELQMFASYLQDIPVSRISSLELLH